VNILRLIKQCVMGHWGVGKSNITIRFVHRCFINRYDPSIEDSYNKQIEFDSGGKVNLSVLDTAEDGCYVSMQDLYTRQAEGFVLVYSITDRPSFNEIKTFYNRICTGKDPEKPNIIIIGNKVDLEKERKVSTGEGQELAKKCDALFMETSALTFYNIDELFGTITLQCLKYRALHPRRPPKRRPKCTIM